MGLDNHIESAVKSVLKNPILSVLREINIAQLLKQSNFVKRSVGHSPFLILLHFVYMLLMSKRQSAFIKQSNDAYGKDTYYRFVQSLKYNWRKLLLLSSSALVSKVTPLYKCGEQRLFIIDDTVESKRGKKIEGSCKSLWSNKDHKLINGINIVSLNYADSHSTFQLDFAIKMNEAKRKELTEFTNPLHHRSNAYKRREETLRGKNTLALDMLGRALNQGVQADYVLVDSWYAKPNFIKEVSVLGMPVIAHIANNERIWNFKGKHKTLGSMHNALSKVRHSAHGRHGKIRYTYFAAVVEHIRNSVE